MKTLSTLFAETCGILHRMLHAICDESFSSDIRTTPFYVVAGFIGAAPQWRLFEELWTADMRALGLESIGCHAAKCANGAKPYDGLSGERRAEIQYRLIVDIAAAKLYGVVSAIDMTAYRGVRQILSECLRPEVRQYNEPHVLCVRQCIQQMCLITAPVTQEVISVVVDRNDAFGKRAKTWYRTSTDNAGNSHRHRFGPYHESDRMTDVGLQAADLLAYAGFRHVAGREGWQWKTLHEGVKISVFTTDRQFWDTLADSFRAGADAQADATTRL